MKRILLRRRRPHGYHTFELLLFVWQQKDDGQGHADVPSTVSVRVVGLRLGKRKDAHADHGENDARRDEEKTPF